MNGANSKPFGLFERMLAGRYLRAKRQHGGVALISVISVLAITLGVFVLIVTMSVMNGFRETLLSRILGVNGHVYVNVQNMPGNEIQRLAALAREAPDVLHVTPIINAQALATSDGMASPTASALAAALPALRASSRLRSWSVIVSQPLSVSPKAWRSRSCRRKAPQRRSASHHAARRF
jgi:ABC-type lipoprotein release transport system permease subunit